MSRLVDDLPLFQAARFSMAPATAQAKPSAVETAIAAISPDDLTPREALDELYRLRALLDGRS